MGYQLEGVEFTLATVTTGTDLETMLHPSTGSVSPYSWTINAEAPEIDITGQGSTAKDFRTGLGSWSATGQAYFPRATKHLGNNGDITWSDATAIAWINGYNLNVESEVLDITSQDQTNKNFKYFRPSKLVGFSGDIDAFYDSAATLILPTNTSTAIASYPTATFKLTEIGAADPTLAGAVILRQLSHTAVQNSTLQQLKYGFRGTGALTAVMGTGSIMPVFPADASGIVVNQPDWDTGGNGDPDVAVTFNAKSAGLIFGGFCFWRRVSIACPMSDMIRVSIELQGTGVYTIAAS